MEGGRHYKHIRVSENWQNGKSGGKPFSKGNTYTLVMKRLTSSGAT